MKRAAINWIKKSKMIRYVPWRFVKIYVNPLLTRKKSAKYDSKEYFDSYYESMAEDGFSDMTTIGPGTDRLHGFFHYNTVENLIFRYFIRKPCVKHPRVLDIGPGAGHWIDFYNQYFEADFVQGYDISEPSVNFLKTKYQDNDKVNIKIENISNLESHDESQNFDIINAIGIMFHIVGDEDWDKAIGNIGKMLNDDGVAIIGGEFGPITQNVEFQSSNKIASKDQIHSEDSSTMFVTKRIRSYRFWNRTCSKYGLKIDRLIKSKKFNEIVTPENNILVIKRKSA